MTGRLRVSHRGAAHPPAAVARRLEFAAQTIEYRLVRSHRRSIAIHIGRAGVEARAPLTAALEDIERFIGQKVRWIVRRLADLGQAQPFSWEPGALLPVLGQPVALIAAPQREGIALENGQLLIGRARPRGHTEWRERVIAWIRVKALALFTERVGVLAPQLDVLPPALRLSNAAGRWGSCAVHRAGVRIGLHWKLYLLPPVLIDYVIAHELAHIRELNHSSRFWAHVARLYPEHAAARRELNRQGRALPIL